MANNFISKIASGILNKAGLFTKADVQSEFKAIALDKENRYLSTVGVDPTAGLKKPSNVSFQTLRDVAKYDALTRICITVIKKSVSQSHWSVGPIDSTKEYDQAGIDYLTDLFTVQNRNNENMRTLLDRVIEDILVLDAGSIEKVMNPEGLIVGLNSVDGATIRPVYNQYGELGEPAYKQYINDKVVAEFEADEMMYLMQNPQNDITSFGYGLSPIESILLVVQASFQADLYNVKAFSENNIPPGMIDLGDMGDDQARQFISNWDSTVINNPRKMKFVWGNSSDKKFQQFGSNNKDMQYIEYTDWLSRIKLASFGLTGIDANITQDLNRATASEQASISKARGVRSIKRLFEEYFNREIIKSEGYDNIEFKFEEAEELSEQKEQAEIDKIRIESGVQTPDEIRARDGYDSTDYVKPEEKPVADDSEADAAAQYLNQEAEKTKSKYYRPLNK